MDAAKLTPPVFVSNAPTEELPNGTIKELQPKHIDICLELREQTALPPTQHLIQGTFGSEESKLMDAAEAPENWAAGHHQTFWIIAEPMPAIRLICFSMVVGTTTI